MNTKLTLLIDKDKIDKAKKYARKENKSLTRLVGDYFAKLSSDQEYSFEISPLVKRLSRVVTLPKERDYKKEYADHLTKKYSK